MTTTKSMRWRRGRVVRCAVGASPLLLFVLTFALVLGASACGGDDSPGGTQVTGAAGRGRQLAQDLGCSNCHSNDGDPGTGPSWEGIWGTTVQLEGGATAVVDRDYIARSVRDPQAEVVDGFTTAMPTFDLSDAEIDALAAYIETLGPPGPADASAP